MNDPSAPSKDILWPDLSPYGVALGAVVLGDGRNTLVFADEKQKFAHIARNMGFSRTRWPGLWVRNDTRVEPSSFRSAFPRVAIVRRSPEDIAAEVLGRIRDIVDRHRQAQAPSAVGDGREATPAPSAPEGAAAAEPIDISPLIAEAHPLGTNHRGEEVFRATSGARFVRLVDEESGQARVEREPGRVNVDAAVLGRFLRGETAESLALAADGLVRTMAEGRTVRVDDFNRFYGAVAENTNLTAQQCVAAVDAARVRRLASLAGAPDESAFTTALGLHEAAQYYSIATDSRMTPLPMAVTIQHIASASSADASLRIENQKHGELGAFIAPSFAPDAEGASAGVLIGAYEPRQLERAASVLGTAVTRLDHAESLQSLAQRRDDGMAVLVVGGDGVPGRIGPSSRRFLDALATHYAIEGIVDIDGALTGTPGAPPSRVIVVGSKRDVPGHGGLPAEVPFVTDYGALWGWGHKIFEAIRTPGSVPYIERGGIAKEVTIEGNAFQAPYIPTSLLSDPSFMVPRNLASPARQAMLDVMKKTPHTDEWLASKLGMSHEQLKSALSAEQADGVTLALHRLDAGLGFMIADMTGTGKGRQLAAVTLAAKLRGEPVVFMTERAELFTDFWRDLEDIGADHHFRNVMVINDGATVTSTRTGEVVARSADRDKVSEVMRSLKYPEGVDLVMATYSQFNRDPVKAINNDKTMTELGIVVSNQSKAQLSATARRMIELAEKRRRQDGKEELKTLSVEAHDSLADEDLIPKMPLVAVKAMWIARAADNAMLLMDESHNASGEVSQTTLNLSHAVMRAKDVVYSSATFARGEKNMRIYRRLFPSSVDVEGLHETLKRGGEALQEAMTSMLAQDGALVRREHDLSTIKFIPKIDRKRKDRNEKVADQLAEILATLTSLTRESRQVTDAMSKETIAKVLAARNLPAKTVIKDVGVVRGGSIGNSFYTITRAFMAILKTDVAVEEAVTAIREGRKPVIVIDHTMEAEMNRAIELARANGRTRETDDGLAMKTPGFRAMLRSMVETAMQVTLDGRELELRQQPQIAEIVRDIEKMIEKFPDFPTSPIDVVRSGIEKAGFRVAELSGRKRRLRLMKGGNCVVETIPGKAKKEARDHFNNGDADAIILTRAGNAGISLHSSHRFVNRGQRELIEVEVPEDVVARTQFFGRVKRNGEVCPPIIKTLSSGLPAEDRQLALQNNKLRKMSANITANRDNAAITRDIADILNTVGNEVAFRFLELKPELAMKLDIELPDVAEQQSEKFNLYGDKYVSKLFSRLILLPVVQQREIIETITDEFNSLVEELEARGENPLRPRFYDVGARVCESKILEAVSMDKKSARVGSGAPAVGDAGPAAEPVRDSAFDRPVLISNIEYKESFEPMPPKAVRAAISKGEREFISGLLKIRGAADADLANRDPETFFGNLIMEVLDRRDSLAEVAKPDRYADVSAALADPKSNNVVKQLYWKTERLTDLLGVLRVGSSISGSTFLNGNDTSRVVVGLQIPTRDKLHYPGHYKVKLATPGRRYIETVSFSSLLGDPNFRVLEQQASKETIDNFAKEKHGSMIVERSILNGNLFRAAEMSLQAGIGTQAFFSDEHGMRHRAVVLPLYADASDFKKLPLRIHEKELVVEYFRDVLAGKLHSLSGVKPKGFEEGFSQGEVKRGMSLSRDGNEIIISVPGTQSWMTWLRNNHNLMAVTGSFGGTRDALYASVPMSQIEPLVDALYSIGITMYAHNDHGTHALQPGVSRRTWEQQDEAGRRECSRHISARQWFVERMGGDSLGAESTKDLGPKDAMADIDAGHGAGRMLKAA